MSNDPEDLLVLFQSDESLARQFTEAHSEMVSLKQSSLEHKNALKPIAKQEKITKKNLDDILQTCQILPKSFKLGDLKVSWSEGREYIDKNELLLLGVPLETIKKATKKAPGFFKYSLITEVEEE
jgi:hypothetical protein